MADPAGSTLGSFGGDFFHRQLQEQATTSSSSSSPWRQLSWRPASWRLSWRRQASTPSAVLVREERMMPFFSRSALRFRYAFRAAAFDDFAMLLAHELD